MDKHIFVHRLDVTEDYIRCAKRVAIKNKNNNFTHSRAEIKNFKFISQWIYVRKNEWRVDNIIK